jgi:WD40 repeat protein
VWNASTGYEIQVLGGYIHAPTCVSVSRDGFIASCGQENTIRIWRAPSAVRYYCESILDPEKSQVHTGWLLTPSSEDTNKEYLAYVPVDAGLPDDHNILTIPSSVVSSIDFTNAALGSDWAKCYQP